MERVHFLNQEFLLSPHLLSQGMLALVLTCIDRLNIYNSVAHFAGIAREEGGMAWKEILNLLYKLLGKCAHALSREDSQGWSPWNFHWTNQDCRLASFLGSLSLPT